MTTGNGAHPTPTTSPTTDRLSDGVVADGFESVRTLFDRHLLADGGYSAQVCAYVQGVKVLDLWGGPDVTQESITGVFSCSKGVAALVLARLIDVGGLDLDARVGQYWPEFEAEGKAEVTVRQLLSHQVGLVGVDGRVSIEDFCESRALARRLGAAMPSWRPGSAFGYHALTIGVFLEELVRRLTGRTLQNVYEAQIRRPLDIDFYLGLPGALDDRFAPLLPWELTPAQLAALEPEPGGPDGLTRHANSAIDRRSPVLLPNLPAVRRSGPAAVGGVGSARGLARVYAAASTGVDGAPALVSPHTLQMMGQEHSWGVDRILHKEMCFGVVFQKPHPGLPFGSHRAIGHDGAGGALGFADPTYGLAFGYIPQRMSYPGGADSISIELSAEIRACLRGA